MRRVAHRHILSRKFQPTGFANNFKHGHVVGSLIAAVQEPTAGIEAETARIVASCPFFIDEAQFAVIADRKNADAVVQAVAGVDELSVVRYLDF